MSALIFIDTDILLDFYRYPIGCSLHPILNCIDKNHAKIITSTQVEMEYKKNRQNVIIETMTDVNSAKPVAFQLTDILSRFQAAQSIQNAQQNITKQSNVLAKNIESILKKPLQNDDVYISLQKLFKSASNLNLRRPDTKRFAIRKLAEKRFTLGYPPQKDLDASIIDAINWEWMIFCAKTQAKDVVIVSRDSAYGSLYDGNMIINDWLEQEFRRRVGMRKKIILTNKLMDAFKLAKIAVKKKQIEDEDKMLSEIKYMGKN